jgi:uncharacterized protein (DUF362 family)
MGSSAEPVVIVDRDTDIAAAVQRVLRQLVLPDLTGKKILLKPNVGREVDPCVGINTNPAVVRAVLDFLSQNYHAQFFLGDSPIISVKTRDAFLKSGYESLMNDPRITFWDLDSIPPHILPISQGILLKEIKVTGYFPQFDYIVSIPALKMHMHTGASLSFKNCKGLIYGREKIKLHHLTAENSEILPSFPKANTHRKQIKELDVAIADLAQVIKPDLAIIDASFALEGMGPSDGTPRRMDTIIASTDFVAADLIALHLAQPSWTIEDVPHLYLIATQQNRVTSRTQIHTIPADLTKFQHPIEPPPKSVTLKYPNVDVIDIDSCSACVSTISTFIKYHKDFIDAHFTPENKLHLAIGKGLKEVHLYEPTFVIGNCARVRKNDGIFINGCAPVQSMIRRTIEEYLGINSDLTNNIK